MPPPSERSANVAARTLADLDSSAGVRRIHIAEAVSYRRTVPGRQGVAA